MKITEIAQIDIPTPEFIIDGERYTANSDGGLIAVPENVAKVMKAQPTNEVIKNMENIISVGLSEAEKSSIEADINAKKPIGDTSAYRKFLQNIFPEKTITFPYLVDYDDALLVVSQLSKLFGKSVRLPNEDEAIQSLADNNHLTGCRDVGGGEVVDASVVGSAWLSGRAQGGYAPYAGRYLVGFSDSDMGDRRFGRSVIPVFG